MPKRTFNEKFMKYQTKIKKLQEKERLQRQRLNSSALSLDSGSDQELRGIEEDVVKSVSSEAETTTETSGVVGDPNPVITIEDAPRYGEKIHDNLARLWIPIFKKGLDNNCKESLKTKYPIPENCTLIQAPKLNTEVAAIITDAMKKEDKMMEDKQQQLGLGIAALNRGMTFLLGEEAHKAKAINCLFDSCRLLSDLHFQETILRRELMMPNIKESLLDITQDVERDDTLFGKNIFEKTKALKNILPQSRKIKKTKTGSEGSQPLASRQRTEELAAGPRHTTLSSAARADVRDMPLLVEPTEPADLMPKQEPQSPT